VRLEGEAYGVVPPVTSRTRGGGRPESAHRLRARARVRRGSPVGLAQQIEIVAARIARNLTHHAQGGATRRTNRPAHREIWRGAETYLKDERDSW